MVSAKGYGSLVGATLVILTERRGRPFENDQSHEVGSWTCCTPRIKAKNAVFFYFISLFLIHLFVCCYSYFSVFIFYVY